MFKSLLLAASLAAAAAAQSIQIGFPAEGAKLKSGSNITVMVERPVRPSPSLTRAPPLTAPRRTR
jgi:hypothetical protein